mgnify:CR=1 FL=1
MLTALFLSGMATAGPWTRELGSYYVQGGGDVYVPTEYVQKGDDEVAVSDDVFTGHLYTLYAEVGLSPKHPVQLVVSLPFARYRVDFYREDAFKTAEGSVTTNHFQDLRIMPQVALHKDYPIAAAVEIKQPLYSNRTICKQYNVFQEICAIPGHGQNDITPWLLIGGSAKNAPFWAEAGLGYLWRTENFRKWNPGFELVDGLTWQTTTGANLGKSFWMIKTKGVKNFKSDKVTNEYASISPGALFTAWDRVGIDLHVGWEFWANNQSRGVTYGAGVSWFK